MAAYRNAWKVRPDYQMLEPFKLERFLRSCEVGQISVSPSGLVWAVTLNGNALVRLGVSRMEPRGS